MTEQERLSAAVAATDECRVCGDDDDTVNNERVGMCFWLDEAAGGDGAVVALSPRSSKDGMVPARRRVAWA